MSEKNTGEPNSPPQYNWFEKWAIKNVVAVMIAEALLTKKISLKEFRDQNNRYGLLEGAILGPSLCFPDEDREHLMYERAAPGEWMAYDFNRPRQFKKSFGKDPPSLQSTGKLMAYLLEEVQGKSSSERTPVGLLEVFSIDHALTINSPTAEELVEEHGYLKPTTYEEAYDTAGLYDDFAEDLARRNLGQHAIYMVTPKGNTLLQLDTGGSPSPPMEDPEFEPAFSRGIRIA
jgi:hypothetical protein